MSESLVEDSWTPDLRLRMRVDEVLHYLWDPIGVSDVPEARDEYYSYSSTAFIMLKTGATAADITNYLRKSRIEHIGMGRGVDLMGEDEIGEILVNWRENIMISTSSE